MLRQAQTMFFLFILRFFYLEYLTINDAMTKTVRAQIHVVQRTQHTRSCIKRSNLSLSGDD